MVSEISSASELLSVYSDGDIPEKWVSLIETHELGMLQGTWEVLPERSDPCDEIMAALGIGILKRSALGRFRSKVEIRVIPQNNNEAAKVHIVTNLPMGHKKEGVVPTDGGTFDQTVGSIVVLSLSSLFCIEAMYHNLTFWAHCYCIVKRMNQFQQICRSMCCRKLVCQD